MKKTAILGAVVGLVGLLLTSCYEDKGNYDYTDVNELTIEMEEGNPLPPDFRLSMGESVELHPVIKFVNGAGDQDRLEYQWTLIPDSQNWQDTYTEEGWNTLDFVWEPDFLIPNGRLQLTVTDPVTGLQSFGEAYITVSSRYDANGAMILSERDGKTMFSFIKGTEFDLTIPTKVEVFEDVYFMENGEDLPAGPLRMHEHFCTDGSTCGQILIMTENGALDISGLDFRKDIDLQDAFDGQSYPEGFNYASDAMFMDRVDLVMDDKGHVYSRLKNTNALFHSGYFLPNQLAVDGEEEPLEGCRPVVAPFKNHMQSCLLYDSAKRRFVMVADTGTGSWDGPGEENAGKPVALPVPVDTPAGVADVFLSPTGMDPDAEIIAINYFTNNDYTRYGSVGYSIVFYKDGKTYCQEITVQKEYGILGFSVLDPAVYEITGLPGKPTFAYGVPSYKYTYANNPMMYLAVGNELYVYDRMNPTLPVVRYNPRTPDGNLLQNGFTADIVDMNCDNFGSRWGVLALADGRVFILKTIDTAYPENQIAYYDSGDLSYGTVKQVLCKTGGSNEWGY